MYTNLGATIIAVIMTCLNHCTIVVFEHVLLTVMHVLHINSYFLNQELIIVDL